MTGFLGQVILFSGSFAPRDWAFCDGQLLAINQNPALYSILGTTYGGDGRITFALPDLRSRIPIGQGSGPGLTHRSLGSKGGAETVTLQTADLPAHSHAVGCTSAVGNTPTPLGSIYAAEEHTAADAYQSGAESGTMNAAWIQTTGGDGPHGNVQPYLPVRYIICINGLFPPRS